MAPRTDEPTLTSEWVRVARVTATARRLTSSADLVRTSGRCRGACAGIAFATGAPGARHPLREIGAAAVSAVPSLVAVLRDPAATVREHAAEALGDIGPPASEAVPPLASVLDDPAPRVRRDAVRSLGQIGQSARAGARAARQSAATTAAQPRRAPRNGEGEEIFMRESSAVV